MHRICCFAGLIALVMMFCCAAARGRSPETLAPLPEGTTLPIFLERDLDMRHVRVGQPLVARLAQRVPLPHGAYLPQKAQVMGMVLACDSTSLTLRFDRLRLGKQEEPIAVKLRAAAHWLDVHDSELPEGGTDRSTSNPASWTTKQIGGDEVYRSAGAGTVYDQYSQPVGHADLYGVYEPATETGGPPRAMGPFSTTAAGMYDIPGIEIASNGGNGNPIVLRLTSPKWQLHGGTALLLVTTAP
jgi:hypothetical protein